MTLLNTGQKSDPVTKPITADAFKSITGTFRQFIYPVEFRISQQALLPSDLIQQLIKAMKPPTPPPPPSSQYNLKYLADVGTGLWRMRRTMVQADWLKLGIKLADAQPKTEMQKAFRWLESAEKRFKEFGLEIQDHNGDKYISGQSLRATFESAPDLYEDTIIDTIYPTIYFDNKQIQMGEVVVGTPDI